MAAALRCAARRLGGSLIQRTQPAVPTRFMHSRHLSGEAGNISVPWAARSLGGSLLERCRTHAPAEVAEERRRLNLMPTSLIHSRGLSSKVPSEGVLQAGRAQRLKAMLESWVNQGKEDKLRTIKEIQRVPINMGRR